MIDGDDGWVQVALYKVTSNHMQSKHEAKSTLHQYRMYPPTSSSNSILSRNRQLNSGVLSMALAGLSEVQAQYSLNGSQKQTTCRLSHNGLSTPKNSQDANDANNDTICYLCNTLPQSENLDARLARGKMGLSTKDCGELGLEIEIDRPARYARPVRLKSTCTCRVQAF